LNEKINPIIKSYLESQNITDYAIMINGVWGCGKTYYVKTDLKELIESLNMRYVYISLNGCDDFTRIINKITMRLLLANRFKSIDIDFLENLYSVGSGLVDLILSAKELPKFLVSVKNLIKKPIEEKALSELNPSGIVIVFDDIERVSNQDLLVAIIGQIYENYTKNGYKTIIVGDEKNIKIDEYKTIKEKVIRRTLSYEPDKNLQIVSFINNQYKNSNYKKCLDNNLDKFLSYFKETNINNLRLIEFIIDSFIYVLDNLDKEQKNKFDDFIFKNILVLSIEYKEGKITIDDLINKKDLMNYPNNYYQNKAFRDRGADIKRTYIDDFFDRYHSIPCLMDIRLLSELINFILTGYLDTIKLENELKSFFYVEYMPEAEKVFNSMTNNLHNFEEADLNKQFENFIRHLEKGDYYITRLPYIYTFLKYIYDKNYISNWPYGIEQIINKSLTEIINKNMIPEYFDPIVFNQEYYEIGRDDSFYLELIKKINDLSHNKRIKYEKEKLLEDFQSIIKDNPLNSRILYNNPSFFQDIVKANSESLFFNLPNKGIRVFETYIHDRFLIVGNAGKVDYNEKLALERIVEYIELNMDNLIKNNNHLRIVRFKELVKSMNDAIKHLEKTNKLE